MIIRADVFVAPVFHAESARNGVKLFEAETFIEMSCMNVGSNDGVELQDAKSMDSPLLQAVTDKLFADMQSAAVPADGVAGVADMTASSYIIWVKNVQTIDFICVGICSNGCVALFGEKVSTGLLV